MRRTLVPVRSMSRRTDNRKSRFPNPRMVHRYLRLLPLLLSVLALLAFGGFVPRANAAELAPAPAGAAETHEALSLKAEPLFTLGKFTVTNSMVVTWIVAAGIIVFAQTGDPENQAGPDGYAKFLGMDGGRTLQFPREHDRSAIWCKKTFWFFATIFIFILFLNWFGLIPGVGTDRLGASRPGDQRLPYRSATAPRRQCESQSDLRDGVGFFVCWIVWALQANGFGGFILHIFGPKGDTDRHSEDPHDRRLFHGRLAGDRLHPVPADLAQLPAFRQHLRRREHARIDGASGAVRWPG